MRITDGFPPEGRRIGREEYYIVCRCADCVPTPQNNITIYFTEAELMRNWQLHKHVLDPNLRYECPHCHKQLTSDQVQINGLFVHASELKKKEGAA